MVCYNPQSGIISLDVIKSTQSFFNTTNNGVLMLSSNLCYTGSKYYHSKGMTVDLSRKNPPEIIKNFHQSKKPLLLGSSCSIFFILFPSSNNIKRSHFLFDNQDKMNSKFKLMYGWEKVRYKTRRESEHKIISNHGI